MNNKMVREEVREEVRVAATLEKESKSQKKIHTDRNNNDDMIYT